MQTYLHPDLNEHVIEKESCAFLVIEFEPLIIVFSFIYVHANIIGEIQGGDFERGKEVSHIMFSF